MIIAQFKLNLGDYPFIFSERKLIVAVIFMAVTIFEALYTSFLPKVYSAMATVKVMEKNALD